MPPRGGNREIIKESKLKFLAPGAASDSILAFWPAPPGGGYTVGRHWLVANLRV